MDGNCDGGKRRKYRSSCPRGGGTRVLWQINIDPAQTDNPDTFDCSEIVQWASGTAVQTGAWIADVTYERAASQPESANNLKQIVLAVHAVDAGECSVDICAQNSPPASPEPVTYAGWGPWGGKHWIPEPLVFSNHLSGQGRSRKPNGPFRE